MRCSISSVASSQSPLQSNRGIGFANGHIASSISTDSPGRIDKQEVLRVLQSSGESYDRARETLKQVSVDASGKVELEDWVEVRSIDSSGGTQTI